MYKKKQKTAEGCWFARTWQKLLVSLYTVFFLSISVSSHERTLFGNALVPLLSPVYRHSVCTDPKWRRTVRDVVALFDDYRIRSARSRVATTAFRLKLPDNGHCGFGLTAGSFVPMLMQTRFHSFSPGPCHRVVHPTPGFRAGLCSSVSQLYKQ